MGGYTIRLSDQGSPGNERKYSVVLSLLRQENVVITRIKQESDGFYLTLAEPLKDNVLTVLDEMGYGFQEVTE